MGQSAAQAIRMRRDCGAESPAGRESRMEEKGKILALDSSGLVASVAVVCGDTLVGEYTVNYKRHIPRRCCPCWRR